MKHILLIFITLTISACNYFHKDKILEPHSLIDGTSLGDLGGEWWQWAYSFSKTLSPINDPSGELCASKQKGDVWFLAGSYSTSPIIRKCTIPHGKKIFFPVINAIYYSPKNRETTCDAVNESVRNRVSPPSNLYVILDGQAVDNPYLHREASSECFDLFPRKIGKSWAFPAASDGYWIAIDSLSEGQHELKFGGSIPNFNQDITYLLTVTSN